VEDYKAATWNERGEGNAKGRRPAGEKLKQSDEQIKSDEKKFVPAKALDFADDSQHQLEQLEALEQGLGRREPQLQEDLARQP